MLSCEITTRNTMIVKWKKPGRRLEAEGQIEMDHRGNIISASGTIRETMPDDFDPEQESRRMKQGGCCGQASE